MVRIIAFLILLIPGIFSAIGIKIMRDALFDDIHLLLINSTVQFMVGLLLFIGGLAFIGGFIRHRDLKNKKIKKNKHRKMEEKE